MMNVDYKTSRLIKDIRANWKGSVEDAVDRLASCLEDPAPRFDNRDRAAFACVLDAVLDERPVLAEVKMYNVFSVDEREQIEKICSFEGLKAFARTIGPERCYAIIADVLLSNIEPVAESKSGLTETILTDLYR